MQRLDVVGIGTLMIDVMNTGAETKELPGGCVLNTISALQRLGLRTGMIGRVGFDGDHILRKMKRDGIETSMMRTDVQPATRCYIKTSPEGQKFLRTDNYVPLKLSEKDKKYLESTEAIFIRARNSQFPVCTLLAKEKTKKIYTSLHGCKKPQHIKQFLTDPNLGTIRVVFANEDEKNVLGDSRNLTSRGVLLVVTRGKSGCTVYSRENTRKFPAFKVNPVDPTGAGDAFAAGYIFGDLKGWPLDKKCRFANALAALSTMEYGANMKDPSVQKIEKFIKSGRIQFRF